MTIEEFDKQAQLLKTDEELIEFINAHPDEAEEWAQDEKNIGSIIMASLQRQPPLPCQVNS